MRTQFYDDCFPPEERLPRTACLVFENRASAHGDVVEMTFYHSGQGAGGRLTDNAYVPDGYRFHDVFHLAYAAILGWSPVLRSLWNRKRKSKRTVDEVEDGGRSIAIEEGICALVFAHANDNDFYHASRVDPMLLNTIEKMTAHLEVSQCPSVAWETAILEGYRVFRQLSRNAGGYVTMDMVRQRLSFSQTAPAVT